MIRLRRLRVNDFKQLRQIDINFPQRGTFLVQGLNEAGKSTLFEAIYVAMFGRPLEAKSLDECVRYGSEESWIELELELPGERTLRIARRLRVERANVWSLEIIDPSGDVEEIRGNAVVNARVEAELGFDGEALLNTCFVEQKKLSKLEGMSRRQRETSLMKLLNLDRLIELGDELKVGRDEEHRLERLRGRAELARLQALEPDQAGALSDVETALTNAEAAEALQRAAEARRVLDTLSEELEVARKTESDLAASATSADRLREALGVLVEGRRSHLRAIELDRAEREASASVEAARTASKESVPSITHRGTQLRRIADRLGFLDSLAERRSDAVRWSDAAAEQLDRLAKTRETLNATRRDLVEARGAERDAINSEADLAQGLRAFDVRSALREFVEALEGLSDVDEPGPRIEVAQAERSAVSGRIAREIGGLVLGAAAVGVAGWMVPAIPWIAPAVVAGLAMVLAATRSYGAARRLGALAGEIGRLEGEASVQQERSSHFDLRRQGSERRIMELNSGVPADVGRGREALAELDQRLSDRSAAEVAVELETVRQTKADATARITTMEAREAELRASVGPVDAEALGTERATKTAWADRAGVLESRQRPRLESAATTFGVMLESAAIERELGALRAELRSARETADRLPAFERERDVARSASAEASSAASVAWQALPVEADTSSPRMGQPEMEQTEQPADPVAWDEAESRIRAAYEAAGGDEVRAAHQKAVAAAADIAGRHGAASRALDAVLETARTLASRAKNDDGRDAPLLKPSAGVDVLISSAERHAALAGGTRPELEAERDRRAETLSITRHDRSRLEVSLDLRGERLDAGVCGAERDQFARELRVRAQAARIVGRAGKNVVVRIMPSTIQHMRHLLPTMTDGRYFDAQLSEDYRMEVYDDRARDWRRKTLFSGGAQDQMSLALRLAFALATLPEERGAAPSFLFLDEPLGAFDSERARSLIDLITEGEIADSFDQIFLISHVRVDPSRFDHKIVLDEGRVVETDLEMGTSADE